MSTPDFNRTTDNMNNAVFLVILVIIGVIYCYCAKKKMRKAIPVIAMVVPPSEDHVWEPDAPTLDKFFIELAQDQLVRFTAQQLRSFTQNYNTILGSGAFGKVYEGQFPNGVKIAVTGDHTSTNLLSLLFNRKYHNKYLCKVKHVNNVIEYHSLRFSHDRNIEEQFMDEVGILARTRHMNLVRLYGFRYDEYKSTLVYEFMENGSLDKHLFSKTKNLAWEKLNKIAIGAAKGIAYLHEGRIIHYGINPGNVLLDVDFSPKIVDYGVARLCKRDDERLWLTGRRDTRVYSAPELVYITYPIGYKCDVYSFGILLFEIAGRRKNRRAWDDWFPRNVWEEYEKGKLMTLLEVCGIEEKYRAKAERMAIVALWCVQDSPDTRPLMSDVVKMLEGRVEIESPPRPNCCR